MTLFSENINLFNHSARTLQSDRQTDRVRPRAYYDNTALCSEVHRAVKTTVWEFMTDGGTRQRTDDDDDMSKLIEVELLPSVLSSAREIGNRMSIP